jgi:hypothetical protein
LLILVQKHRSKCKFCQENEQFEGTTEGQNQLESSWPGLGWLILCCD